MSMIWNSPVLVTRLLLLANRVIRPIPKTFIQDGSERRRTLSTYYGFVVLVLMSAHRQWKRESLSSRLIMEVGIMTRFALKGAQRADWLMRRIKGMGGGSLPLRSCSRRFTSVAFESWKKSDNRAFCADGKFPFYAETMKEEDVSSPSFNYYLGRVKSLQIRKWVVGIIPKIIMTQFWGEGSAQKNCWWTNEDHWGTDSQEKGIYRNCSASIIFFEEFAPISESPSVRSRILRRGKGEK